MEAPPSLAVRNDDDDSGRFMSAPETCEHTPETLFSCKVPDESEYNIVRSLVGIVYG
jgi:hypothetical protein